MVKAHSSRKLEYDPSQLSVTELKFVIDHPLTTSELEWARKRIFPSLGFRQDLLIDPIRSSSSQCIGFQLASWEIFPRVDPFQRGHLRRSSLLQFHGWQGKGNPYLDLCGAGQWRWACLVWFFEKPGAMGNGLRSLRESKLSGGQCDRSPIMETDNRRRVGRPCPGRKKNLSGFRGKAVDYFAWALVNRDSPFYRESLVRARTLHPTFAEVWKKEAGGLKTKRRT